MDDQHGEPTSDALARAVQTLAVTASLVEAIARVRAQRAHDRAADDERAVTAARAANALRHNSARLLWTPAFDGPSLRRMSATELLDAWAASSAYRGVDPGARQAAERLEDRLRDLHPEAMSQYDDAVARGERRDLAMAAAVGHFRGEYGFAPPGTPLHFAEAAAAQDKADSAGRADDVRTTIVDEATTATITATVHAGTAADHTARGLADLAQPVDIETAMARAPQAAKAMLALPPAPTRRQLTARPFAAASAATVPGVATPGKGGR